MALVVLRSGKSQELVVEAFSQESCQERCVEHGAPQALVCFQKRTAPHGKEEGRPPYQAALLYQGN